MAQAQAAKASALQRLVRRFEAAFRELGHEASAQQFEAWSVLIHECMSGRGRRFHTVEHVFDISSGAPPLETLAILFHDTVYVQVDGGLPRPVEEILNDAIDHHDGKYVMRPVDREGRPLARIKKQPTFHFCGLTGSDASCCQCICQCCFFIFCCPFAMLAACNGTL